MWVPSCEAGCGLTEGLLGEWASSWAFGYVGAESGEKCGWEQRPRVDPGSEESKLQVFVALRPGLSTGLDGRQPADVAHARAIR